MKNDELISNEDISAGLNLKKLKLSKLAPIIMKLLKLEKVNQVYDSSSAYVGSEFIDQILKEIGVEYEVSEDSLQNIPKDEPFIAIANHPYGGIDGLMLMAIFTKVRPDFKVMANYLLQQIPQLKDNIVSVNPFEKTANQGMNISGIKRCLTYINEGAPIGIFPAGEVSSLKLSTMKISDKMWNPVVGKMIMKSGARVVPVYFSGHNSVTFNLLGLVHPALRTAKLPSELFNKKNEKITVRIGKPISIKTLQTFEDPNDLLRFARAKTYALGSALDVKKYFDIDLKGMVFPSEPEAIIDETPLDLILQDITRAKERDLLFTQDNYQVFM